MSERRKFKPLLETRRGIDLAPMVDIIFLLLAYFLINSTLARNPAIRIDLPKSQTSSYVSEQAIDIFVREDGEILINKRPVPIDEISGTLTRLISKSGSAKAPEINIKGEGRANYQRVIAVIDEVRKAGLRNFNLSTSKH